MLTSPRWSAKEGKVTAAQKVVMTTAKTAIKAARIKRL
jgi:hypothetical protein